MQLSNVKIDFDQQSLWLFIGITVFNPFYWNLVGRLEYRKQYLTSIFGSKELACYVFAFTIFALGLLRDYLFTVAIMDQPIYDTEYQFVRIASVAR